MKILRRLFLGPILAFFAKVVIFTVFLMFFYEKPSKTLGKMTFFEQHFSQILSNSSQIFLGILLGFCQIYAFLPCFLMVEYAVL